MFDPDYSWHGLARICQTPGDDETEAARRMGGPAAERAERMAALGISRPVAAAVAAAQGPETARASSGSTAPPPSRRWRNSVRTCTSRRRARPGRHPHRGPLRRLPGDPPPVRGASRGPASGLVIDPGEALTVAEALRSFTIDAAYGCGMEAGRGSLEPGERADLAVLTEDPFAIPVSRLRDVTSELTMVAGRTAWPPADQS